MLIGIVVKNGIVLVDYTNLQRERGMGITQAVVTAGHSRLRPVLMTTLTTVLGMIPLAIGTGEGSEMWRGMGLTVACKPLMPRIFCAGHHTVRYLLLSLKEFARGRTGIPICQ